MTKCEVIDLTLSDSGSAISVHTASVSVSSFCTSSSCYNGNYFTGLVHVVVMNCSLAKSSRLICIARSSVSFASRYVRAKRFTGSSGKTSLDLTIGC